MEAQLYPQCERYYPFVLGAQPVRLIDLAASTPRSPTRARGRRRT